MPEKTWKCPNCGASLAPGPFSRNVTCTHCGTVVRIDEAAISASRFRDAHAALRRATPEQEAAGFQVADDWWMPREMLAQGEIADVFHVERVRPPSLRAVLKVLRSEDHRSMLEAERATLEHVHATGASLDARVPRAVAHGVVTAGVRRGASASVFRFAPGFVHTFAAIRAAFPRGVDGRVAVWMWRRVLETLAALHQSGRVHGGVVPVHLLAEDGEHGVRLVGFGCAGTPGTPLAGVVTPYESLYPAEMLRDGLDPRHDVRMSAGCIASVLGASDDGTVPASVPAALRDLVHATAREPRTPQAWGLRERLGGVAKALYGPPSFNPLVMPSV